MYTMYIIYIINIIYIYYIIYYIYILLATEEDPGLNPKDCNSMRKVLVQQGQEFAEKLKKTFQNPSCAWDARSTSITDGPAAMLAMDDALAMELQKYQEGHRQLNINVGVLDRTHLATEKLSGIFIYGGMGLKLHKYQKTYDDLI